MQHRINLVRIWGRPFDVRILFQKPERKWGISGICAKVVAPGKIVTNYCKGGQPLEFVRALCTIMGGDVSKEKIV
jgi:hypothetical protein